MNKDNFTRIAFNIGETFYVTSIAEPVLGDTVIAFKDYSRVYTFDEQREEESDVIAYTKVIVLNEAPPFAPEPDLSLIKGCKEFAEMTDYVQSGYYRKITKAECNMVLEPVRTEPKILPNDKCPCGSNLKYKKCCKNKI